VGKDKMTSRTPWAFIPTLYFAEGVPYVIINTVSVILYKRMGVNNALIAFWTSLFYLPWVIKMFWGPLVDLYSTKRNWILMMQFAMAVTLGLSAISLRLEHFFYISLVIFAVGAQQRTILPLMDFTFWRSMKNSRRSLLGFGRCSIGLQWCSGQDSWFIVQDALNNRLGTSP